MADQERSTGVLAGHRLGELFGERELRELLQQFTRVTGCTVALFEHPSMKLVVATGWRRICAEFHRACPESVTVCAQSDRQLLDALTTAGELGIARCAHGLLQCAGAIVVGGERVGYLLLGQVLAEPPDLELFREHARHYGFNAQQYLAALAEVPVYSGAKLEATTAWLRGLAMALSQQAEERLAALRAGGAPAAAPAADPGEAERRRAALRIRDDAELLEAAFLNSPDIIVILDADNRIEALNRSRVPGHGVGEYLGADGVAILPARDQPLVRDCLERARATGQVQHVEHEIADGIFVSTRVVPLQGGARPGRILILASDVTEQRQATEALRDRELRFRSIFDSVFELVVLLEPNGTVLEVNRAARELAGTCSDQLVGRPFWECPFWRASSAVQEELRAAIARAASGEFVRYEVELQGGGGKRIPVDFCITPMRDETGRITLLVPEGRNIEELRRVEEQLRQREKMAAIGQLAGGIAHDFNNQLSGVLGYAELLARLVGDGQARQYVDGILTAGHRAADLTGQLLAFSRKGKLLSVPVDVHRLVDEVVAILGRSIDKRIRIVRALGASDATALGDPTQLQNMLLNLALNARDAMPGGGELRFATETVTLGRASTLVGGRAIAPGSYLVVRIVDDGCGMSDEVKRHLFEPFFTTKPLGLGTGMGLASAYGTVRAHHGAIDVQSAVGHGTTITLWLPLAVASGASAPAARAPEPARGHGCVLVVDDEPLVLEVAAAVLEQLGYEVVTATNGQEAVEHYQQHWQGIDLVLLDLVMPAMGGREAFVAMRRINPGVRALISSGYGLESDVRAILQEGVLGFMAKPYRAEELAAKVAEALRSPKPMG